ncbi:hypothetical protein E9840_06130 [Tissierella creatinini]|nr:hypothetical protein E9840_06130 [Tissierella creatinini]TJX64326.1 hypothetical protein E8P77_12590 [Soehngenia saccharolytica]
MKKRVIIDCDPGIDDAIALMLAFASSDIDIAFLTTCFGNNTLEQTTENALNLAYLFGSNVDIYKGAEKPLFVKPRGIPEFHGINGIGGAKLEPSPRKIKEEYAWDAIYKEALACNGELTLITLGPLTNVAIALYKYEDLPKYIKEIVVMGGSSSFGNELPFSEANVFSDPHAFQTVINAKIKVKMVGLNATETTRVTFDEMREIFGVKTRISDKLDQMLEHYLRVQNKYGEEKLVIHDAAAMAVAISPEIAESEIYPVSVELTEGRMFGRTIVDIRLHSKAEKNVDVVRKIDFEAYKNMLKQMVGFYK